MSLDCANWSDKSLDELNDLLATADHSRVASFIAENFLCVGSRIMTDPTNTTLRVTVNGGDAKAVDLSPGVFLHASKVSQLDSSETINILDTVVGTWGLGKVAHATLNRWSIICVNNNQRLHTSALRWFVDDTVDPNTYSQQNVNTLINKAYYDITVVHGVDGAVPVVPDAPAGTWTIAEIYVPAASTAILFANIYDTATAAGSQHTVPNWNSATRVLRLEFGASMFGVDHSTVTGYHKQGDWHIGTEKIEVLGTEFNDALYGGAVGARVHELGGSVKAKNLTTLTSGPTSDASALHSHGAGVSPNISNAYSSTSYSLTTSFTDLPLMSISITLSVPTSVLLMATLNNTVAFGRYYNRFVVDGTPLPDPAAGWYAGTIESLVSFQQVVSLTAGVHTIKVQSKRFLEAVTLGEYTLTVVRF